MAEYISIPAFREEGDGSKLPKPYCKLISIPAFREEGDLVCLHDTGDCNPNFNPRLP